MLRHKFELDFTPAGVGIILAGTPESRSVFVAIIVPAFDENTSTTFSIAYDLAAASCWSS
jgi:hypothetical protein